MVSAAETSAHRTLSSLPFATPSALLAVAALAVLRAFFAFLLTFVRLSASRAIGFDGPPSAGTVSASARTAAAPNSKCRLFIFSSYSLRDPLSRAPTYLDGGGLAMTEMAYRVRLHMAHKAADRIRNVALIGHRGSGKTSLHEALLFEAGVINRLGSVDDGSTVSDFEADEQAREMSIGASVASFEYGDRKINLIDTPGE